jgi:hypothetical protein
MRFGEESERQCQLIGALVSTHAVITLSEYHVLIVGRENCL